MTAECQHEDVEYEEGNYVAPYGWETYPGMYCMDCGEMVNDEMGYRGPGDDSDVDAAKDARWDYE